MTNEEMGQIIQKLVIDRLTACKWITTGGIVSIDGTSGQMAKTSWRFKFTEDGLEKTKQLITLLSELGYTSGYRTGELDSLMMLLRPYGLGTIGPEQALDPSRR